MRKRILFLATGSSLAAVLLGGCASTGTFRNAKATVELERLQIREINEAFKSSEDKTITVPRVGEVDCPDHKCLLPVRGVAERVAEGQPNSETGVDGVLVLWGDVTQRLIQMLDQAQYTAKDQTAKGFGGQVTCNKTKCVFAFSLDEKELRADGRAVFEEAPRMPASENPEEAPAP